MLQTVFTIHYGHRKQNKGKNPCCRIITVFCITIHPDTYGNRNNNTNISIFSFVGRF